MTSPLVTIAIPCFNAQKTIERAIKSAQNQDWPNTEILIVDDGSKDGAVRVIEALAKEDKRIRLIGHEANQGVAFARNTLLEKAKGEFIAFFDADDVSYPERIRLQYQRLTHYEQENKTDLILCYGARRVVSADGMDSYELKGVGHRRPEPVGWEYVGHYIPVKSPVKKYMGGDCGSCTLFMRRAVFGRVGLFDASLYSAEDIDYAIRAGLKGAHFISVNQPVIDWHVTEADYKTDDKLLHYHRLMYQKYKYLFSSEFQYSCAWQRSKVALCRYIATSKNKYFPMIWYCGWACFWLFLLSPRAFFNKGADKLEDFLRNRRAHKAEIMMPKKIEEMPQPLDTNSLVTIAIPCFNAEPFIERAIKSAQNQDWPTIEILVVDDASEDRSVAIIEALAKKDKRIRLICQKTNQGAATARNTLLEKAKGEFIAFFDADDVSYPERVRLQYQRLTHYERESKADLILCYGTRRVISADGTKPYKLKGVGHRAPEPVGWEYIGHYFPVKNEGKKYVGGDCGSCTLFMRRAVFGLVGPFDSALRRGQDIDYAIRAGLKGAHFISVNQPVIDWHITEADYKTDKILLHYHRVMHQKYKYLFASEFQYNCAWQRSKVALRRYIATSKNEYFSMIWYCGWACFWLFLLSPRAFFNKGLEKIEDFFRNRRAHKAEMMMPKKVTE